MWIARLAYNFTTPNSLSGWGRQNLPACLAGPPESGSGSCPGSKPYTLHFSSNVTLTSWPQIWAFFSSTTLACAVQRRLFSSRSLAGTISQPLLCMTPRRCPVFVGPLCTWPPWVSGAHLQSFIRASSVPGALYVIHVGSVGNWHFFFGLKNCDLSCFALSCMADLYCIPMYIQYDIPAIWLWSLWCCVLWLLGVCSQRIVG